jgi:tetratricopeptide (TPR) repeat protein
MKNISFVTAWACACFIFTAAFGADTAPDLKKLGLGSYNQKDYVQAEKYFQQALQLNPQDWFSAQMAGYCATWQGHKDEAIKDYQLCLQIKPDNPKLRDYLGKLWDGAALKAVSSPAGEPAPQSPSQPAAASNPNPNYVWDPAVDPYPLYTEPPSPLPKPVLPVIPELNLTASYGMGFIYFSAVDSTQYYYPGILSLDLHYQLSPSFSLALGTEIWPTLSATNSYEYAGSLESNTQTYTDTFNVTPVSLGFFLHSFGKDGMMIDAGISLAAFFYTHQSLSDELDIEGADKHEYIDKFSANGEEFGFIFQFDFGWPLLDKDQLAFFLTGKGYLDTGIGSASGTGTFTEIDTVPPANPVTQTNPAYFYNQGLAIIGGTLGIGLRGGF